MKQDIIPKGKVDFREPNIIACPHCGIRLNRLMIDEQFYDYFKLIVRNYKDRPFNIRVPVALCPNCHKEFARGEGIEE